MLQLQQTPVESSLRPAKTAAPSEVIHVYAGLPSLDADYASNLGESRMLLKLYHYIQIVAAKS